MSGAGQGGNSANPAKAAALRFDSHEDTLSFVAELSERAKRAYLGYRGGLVERYINGCVGLEVSYGIGAHCQIAKFVFVSVPTVPETCDGQFVCGDGTVNRNLRLPGEDGEWREVPSVFLGICQMVYGPEGVLRSGLWVKSADDVGNVGVQINVGSDLGRDLIDSVAKGKFDLSKPSNPNARRDNGCVNRIIEHIPYIGDGIERDAIEFEGDGCSKSNFVNFLSGYRLIINDVGVLAVSEKQSSPNKELINMSVRIIQCEPGSGKRVFNHVEPA